MTWWQVALQHVVPVLVAGGGAWIARGKIAARTAAANAATDQAADAALKKHLHSDFDEVTRH
jgi:hypothetical protein